MLYKVSPEQIPMIYFNYDISRLLIKWNEYNLRNNIDNNLILNDENLYL